MSQRTLKPWFLTVAILAVIVVAAVSLVNPSRPRLYQGKTVREWVTLLDPQVGQEKKREEAAWAIVQIGSNAVPDLERILVWRPNRLRDTAQAYATRFGLMKPPELRPQEMSSRACEAAYHLGEDSEVDISRLVPHLRYHFTNGTYADVSGPRALAGAGPTGIAVLTNLLTTGNRNVRDQAGWALSLYPVTRRKPEVFTALIHAARAETDRKVRANFLLYLQGSRAPAGQIVPVAMESLRSLDAYERGMAARLLQDYAADESVAKALESAGTQTNRAEPRPP